MKNGIAQLIKLSKFEKPMVQIRTYLNNNNEFQNDKKIFHLFTVYEKENDNWKYFHEQIKFDIEFEGVFYQTMYLCVNENRYIKDTLGIVRQTFQTIITGATFGIVGNGSTSFATKEKNIAKYSVATEVYNIFMQGMDDYEKQMEQNKKNKWGMK